MTWKNKELAGLIYFAFGEVSMCWSKMPDGIFQSEQATKVGERLINEIEDLYRSKKNRTRKN